MAKVKLSSYAQSQLDELGKINFEWRNAKIGIEAEIRKLVQAQIEDIESEQARQVHALLALGVPKSRIGREGLHTKDPRAVDAIAESRPMLSRIVATGVVNPKLSWEDKGEKIVRVDYPDYHEKMAHPYPMENIDGQFTFRDPLKGLVQRAGDSDPKKGFWRLLEDGNAIPEEQRPTMPRAFVEGPLEGELGQGMPLRQELDTWLAENS